MDNLHQDSIKINDSNYNLQELETFVWKKLINGSVKKKNGFRTMCVATISAKSEPSQRVVVNRKVTESTKIIYFHTDNRSRKCYDLKNDNRISLLFYDARQRIQIVAKAHVMIDADPLYTNDRWKATSAQARLSYMTIEPPNSKSGKPTLGYQATFSENKPTDEESNLYQKNFSVLSCQVYELEFLYLDYLGNRKANFSYQNGILDASFWAVP